MVEIHPRPLFGRGVPEHQWSQADTANAKEDGYARNGSMLSIQPRTRPGKRDRLGFDSCIRQERYDPTLFVRVRAIKPGDMLISTISLRRDEKVKPIGPSAAYGERKPTVFAAALTCVGRPVAADAFRPSYGDGTRKIYYAGSLRRELRPQVAATPAMPKVEQYIDMLARPKAGRSRTTTGTTARPSRKRRKQTPRPAANVL